MEDKMVVVKVKKTGKLMKVTRSIARRLFFMNTVTIVSGLQIEKEKPLDTDKPRGG